MKPQKTQTIPKPSKSQKKKSLLDASEKSIANDWIAKEDEKAWKSF